MGRPKKEGAEYFPHFTSNGKTIFTLESMHGNDGYAFWFKLLEILCSTEGHFYRTNNPPEWLFLVSKTRVTAETATAILQTLADLEAIDPDLLTHGVIWCEKLVDNLRPVYAKRKVDLPSKPEFPAQKVQQTGVSGAESTQRKEEESKEKKKQPIRIPDGSAEEDFYLTKKKKKLSGKRLETFLEFWEAFNYKRDKAPAADAWLAIPQLTDRLVGEIVAAARRAAADRPALVAEGKTPKMAEGWLTARRWEDEVQESVASTPAPTTTDKCGDCDCFKDCHRKPTADQPACGRFETDPEAQLKRIQARGKY